MASTREKRVGDARRSGLGLGRRELLKILAGGLWVGTPLRHAFGASEPRHVEIAVIGAGLFGASAAMHLVADGARSVLLVGPSEIVGGGSTAQQLASHYDESRNLTAMDADLFWAELARSSVEPLRALEKRSGLEILQEIGSLRVTQARQAESYFDLDGIRETAAKLAVPLVELDSSALRKRYPEARFDPESHGLLQELDAGLLRPRRLVAALRSVAVEDGVTWIDDEVANVEPQAKFVELILSAGTVVRARRVLIATGAAPIGHALLDREPGRTVNIVAHRPTHVEVPENFETTLPPTMITNSDGDEFFGGFVAPPLRYRDGRRYLKVVGQTHSLKSGAQVPDQVEGAVRAVKRLFPSLEPGAVNSGICMTTDTKCGRPIIDWIEPRIAVAIAGNGKGAKAALEIGRRAASWVASSRRV